jgi:general secretion pathway protein D
MTRLKLKQVVVLSLLLLLVGGCAGRRAFVAGGDLMQAGNYDEAVAEYFRAVSKEPANKEYRMRLLEARGIAAQQHLKKGRILASREEYRSAAAEFEQAAGLDPSADVARKELQTARNRQRAEELLRGAEQHYAARKLALARSALNEALQLRPDYEPALVLLEKVQSDSKPFLDGIELEVSSTKPITLKFNNADVREVFGILSKLSGIKFIFDEDIRAQRVTVLLEDASFAQALEFLLNMNKLGKKVLNPKTIIIYPKTKEKEKQYEDHLIQTFYLSNIDAKKAVNLLRTMLQLRKIYVHEELNALVIRDTPEAIQLARQIIEAADRGDSEVLFDLELIEVNHTDDLNFGPKLSTYSVSAGLSNPGSGQIVGSSLSPGSDTTNLVSSLSRLETFYTLPTATFDFLKRQNDAEVLANPKIRVKNKEKAKVLVGTREPVITVTRTGGTTGDFSENVQYVDVGVKLDIEPIIQLDESVVTKLNLEVSSVSGRQTTSGGSQVITITTTNAQTGLTLKDGERTIIGGLIRDDATNSRSTIPLIGDLPLIGNLLTSYTKNKTKREILLSITPHIVRTVEMPRADVATIWSGGEDALKAGPIFGSFGPAIEPATLKSSAAPAVPQPAAPSTPPVLPESVSPAATPDAAQSEIRSIPETPSSQPEATAVQPVIVPPSTAPVQPLEAGEQVALPHSEVAVVESRAFLAGPARVEAEAEFAVDVLVEGMQNLYSAPLFIGYDPQMLEFVRAEEGDFLKQGAQTTIFTSSANTAAGKVIVGNKQGAEGSGASGGGKLLHLVFKARAAGVASLGLERLNFRDPNGNRLPVTTAGITVEVR